MAQNYSPRIVQDGLIMCLDPSLNKSYPTTDIPVKNGLLLWLDAADDTTFSYSSGSQVSQWRDKSGNNFHANQSTTAQQPLRNTINNSRKSVFFNAASRLDYMTISSGISLPNDASIFIIYKPATQIYNYAVLIDNYHGLGGAYGFVIQRVNNLSQFYYANGDGSNFVDASASPWTYTDNVIQLSSLNKSSSTVTPYISGNVQTNRTVFANTSQYTTGLAIGYWGNGGGRFYNGDMCEILIFNRSLNSTEMKQVHTYLGQKWGILNTDRSVIDLSGNNNNGLFGNGTTANMPKIDFYNKGTFFFDDANDEILTNIPITSTPALSNFTYEMWIKLTNFPTVVSPPNAYNVTYRAGFLMGASSYGGAGLLWYGDTNGAVCTVYAFIRGNDAYRTTSGINLALNQYYHLVMVNNYGSNKLQLYVNGSLYSEVATATQEYNASNAASANNIGIAKIGVDGGGTANYSNYAGRVGLARIYSKALSASEIVQNYESQKARFANTLVQQGLVFNIDAGNPYSYAGSGITIYDVSANTTNSGSLIGGTSYSTSNGGVFVFDGVDDYILTNYSQTTDNIQVTWEAWFWDNSAGFGANLNTAIISNYGPVGTTPFTLLHIYDNGYPFFAQRNSSGTESNATYSVNICDGIWHHLVGVVDGTNTLIYVDGVLRASQAKVTGTTTSGQNIVIGGNHLGRYQSCRIGSARIYNIALSATQVLQNYNATKARFGL